MNPEIINKDNNLYQSYQGELRKTYFLVKIYYIIYKK